MAKSLAKTARFPERRLVAKVERAERIGPPPYGRTSFEFDGVDASVPVEQVDRILENPEIVKPFATIRIVTTENLLDREFGFVPQEGDWVELLIRPKGGDSGPLAFHSQLENDGYAPYSRGMLDDIRLIARIDEVPPAPLSASVPEATRLATALMIACKFPAGADASRGRIRRLVQGLTKVSNILVRDVGQASFTSLRDAAGKIVAHFDAGWPISFNGRTAPRIPPVIRDNALVILSHWDWDHLGAYYKCSKLQSSRWITPIQNLSPGKQKIANQLKNLGRLHGYDGKSIHFPRFSLLKCGGLPMNHNGLALDLILNSGKRALLVGDAHYNVIGSHFTSTRYDLLVVTHHGANFDGNAPHANRSAKAVISVGRSNVYKHPRAAALSKHRGWSLDRTCSHNGRRRADRTLGP